MKALASVLSKRFGIEVAEPLVPEHPMLGDVDSPEALAEYQAAKRAYKAGSSRPGVKLRRTGPGRSCRLELARW